MPRTASNSSTDQSRIPGRPGFTLIELLVVIAIIALLIGIIVPAMAGARAQAVMARELSASQQLMLAYSMYADESDDALLIGFAANGHVAGDKAPRDRVGDRVTGEPAKRYPWRLAPWLEHNWSGLTKQQALLEEIQEQNDTTTEQYLLSLYPTFGVNATFVGGDANNFAFEQSGARDSLAMQVFGDFVVTRLSQVRRPGQLMAFVTARGASSDIAGLAQDPEGYFKVNPPRFSTLDQPTQRWDDTYNPNAAPEDRAKNSGFVSMRHSGKAIGVMLDGHAQTLDWTGVRDMTRWSNQATSADWAIDARAP